MIYFDTFTKMPKNVGDLDKLIVAKGFKKLPKSNKLPNLVTLLLEKKVLRNRPPDENKWERKAQITRDGGPKNQE